MLLLLFRYVDRLTDKLKQKLQLADKMVFYQKQSVAKRNQALEEQRELEPKLDVITQRTKELQKQVHLNNPSIFSSH